MFDREQLHSERERACVSVLQALRREVSEQSASFSKPSGFFVSEKERQDAYLNICKLLLRIEPTVTSLRQSISDLIASMEISASGFSDCDEWRSFYEQSVTAFLDRIEKAADFEHDGKAADISSAGSICTAFCQMADIFLKTYTDSAR